MRYIMFPCIMGICRLHTLSATIKNIMNHKLNSRKRIRKQKKKKQTSVLYTIRAFSSQFTSFVFVLIQFKSLLSNVSLFFLQKYVNTFKQNGFSIFMVFNLIFSKLHGFFFFSGATNGWIKMALEKTYGTGRNS